MSELSKQNLQKARKLIENKRYSEARQLLQKMENPTATKWLHMIDDLESSKYTISENNSNNTLYGMIFLGSMTVLVLFIAVYGSFIRPVGVVSAQEKASIETNLQQMVDLLGVIAGDDEITEALNSSITQWEYMTVEVENRIIGPIGSISDEDNVKRLGEGVYYIDYIENGIPEFIDYLNDLGRDGWEMVNFTYNSGEVGGAFIFKRPLTN